MNIFACSLYMIFASSLSAAACQNNLNLNIPTNDPDDIASAEMFKSVVEERTGGATCVQLFPASTLYSSTHALAALQQGQLDISIVPANRLAKISRGMKIFQAPFLFNDPDTVHEFMMDSSSSIIMQPILDNGLVPLTFWSANAAQLYSEKPIQRMEDLAGATVRVMGASGLEGMADSMDFSVSRAAWSAFSEELSKGDFSTFETTLAPDRVYGLAGSELSVTATNHSYDANFLLMNRNVLYALDEATREIVLDAGALSGSDRKKRGCTKKSSSMEIAEANGLAIATLADRDYQKIQEHASRKWGQFIDTDILAAAVAFCPECSGTAPRPKPKCKK